MDMDRMNIAVITQRSLAEPVAEEMTALIDSDTINTLDLLDSLASCGLQLTISNKKTLEEYIKALAEQLESDGHYSGCLDADDYADVWGEAMPADYKPTPMEDIVADALGLADISLALADAENSIADAYLDAVLEHSEQ
jgi:hypothetical protein